MSGRNDPSQLDGGRHRVLGGEPAKTESRPDNGRSAPQNRLSRRDFRHARSALRTGAWFRRQARGVRFSVAAIGAFAALNLLTTGLSHVWFVYPSIPFALFLAQHFLTRRA